MEILENMKTIKSFVWESSPVKAREKEEERKTDTVEISNTAKVYDKIDRFLNLGRPDRLDVDDLNEEEKKEFLKMLADLISKGIVGYEVLEVNKRPEKHFMETQIGDKRIYGAKLYRRRGYYTD